MTTYTLFAQANPGATSSGAGNNGTNGLHFNVSSACTLDGIWHYSPSGATQLPTSIGLYTVTVIGTSGTLVHSETASWSGAAGSGWVFASFSSPPSLSSGTEYMAVQFRNDSSNRWFDFYTVTWPVTSGILTAPKDTGTGQGWYNIGTAMAFPTTQLAGDNFGMDVQVSTSSSVGAPARLTPPGRMAPAALARHRPPLPAPPAAVIPGTTGLSGTGTLAAAGTDVKPGAAGLSGTGTLTATGSVTGATLSGTGTLTATGTDVKPGAAALSGAGTLTAAETLASLDGEGTLGAAGAFAGTAAMAGTGTLGISGETLGYVAALAGTGTLRAYEQVRYAALAGTGTLGISGETLGYVAALAGTGFMSIPQVAGGLVNGVGGAAAPQALPGSSQVAVAAPGSSNWQWLGTLGQVTALTYSYTCPGGPDKMQATIMVPASYRSQVFNPGWQVKIVRGGHQVWYGKLDEPKPSAQGWTLTAVGAGNLGQNFAAYYATGGTWPSGVADDILNRAITRGLPWVNPGMASSPYYSQFWFGQQVDPASQTVTAFLNLICTRGGLTWYVSSQPGGTYNGNNLSVFPLPAVPDRLLVCTTPVARTLGGDINYIYIRYQATADDTTTSTAATYAYVAATNPASIAAHGQMEATVDLSDAGVMTGTQAQAVGQKVLGIYQRASFAGPFTASYGQLLSIGGAPVDPGTDQAGTMMRLVLTDYAYGGEVSPGPVSFIVGAYEWDDFAQVATITPYQTIDQSLSGLLSMENTILTPVQAAG